MTHDIPLKLVAIEDQPPVVEIHIIDGIFVKQMLLRRAGQYAPQHAHRYDHLSMLAAGSVRVWADGVCLGDKTAPTGICIPANQKHVFLALEDNSVLYCIHNVSRADSVEITEEHELVERP